MGGKIRLAKYIVPILQDIINKNNITTYIEPFCGGCNIIDKITCEKRIANDKNKYLIELFKNIEKVKELPENISREHYSDVRECFYNNSNKYDEWYIGAIGFLSSYNGRFFDGGYAGKVTTKTGIVKDFYKINRNSLLKQNLNNIEFIYRDYRNINYDNTLIYCDPPYNNTKKYNISKDFNYSEFWSWCENMSKNNIVVISELEAPDNFKCIWEQQVNRTINHNTNKKSIEKLFTINNI